MLWEEYTTLVNPLMPIPDEVTALTGIDDAMVADAPAADEVAPAIAEFLGDGVFTAHNAPFDLGFVNSTLAKGKFERIQNPVLCTCKLARRLLPNLYSKSLGPVAKQLGIRNTQRHRAAGDAYATAQVLIQFLRRLEEEFEVVDMKGLMASSRSINWDGKQKGRHRYSKPAFFLSMKKLLYFCLCSLQIFAVRVKFNKFFDTLPVLAHDFPSGRSSGRS